LDLGPPAITRNPGRPEVYHETDPRYGERCLGDVRSEDDSAPRMWFEDPVLFSRGQPAVQSQDFGAGLAGLDHRLRRVADFPFSW